MSKINKIIICGRKGKVGGSEGEKSKENKEIYHVSSWHIEKWKNKYNLSAEAEVF